MTQEKSIYTQIINYCIFLSLAFLLCTKNFTVGTVVFLLITSIVYIIKNHKNIVISKFDLLIISILSSYFLSSIPVFFKDLETTRYFKGSIRYLCFIPIYILIKYEIKSPSESRGKLDAGVILGSMGTIIISLYQSYILDIERVEGFLYSINFSYLSCSLAFLALVLSIDSHFKLLLIFSFILDLYSTILTETRGAIFTIPILTMAFFIFYKKENRIRRIFTCILASFVLIFGTYSLSSKTQTRIINQTIDEVTNIFEGNVNESFSLGTRINLWYGAVLSFSKSPIIGQTYQEREKILDSLYKNKKINFVAAGTTRAHAHNQYFEMLASYGILGVISFIFLLFIPLIYFLKRIDRTNYALTGFIFVMGFALFCMTEVPLEQNLISTYYGLMLVLLIHFTNIDIENKKLVMKD